MAKKALIVDDDPRIMKIIEETLQGLNHEHVWVTNQHDARRALDIEQFDYVLLELRIPAKPRRGGTVVRMASSCSAKSSAPALPRTARHHDDDPRGGQHRNVGPPSDLRSH